jgi:lysophospholipase L1-like esterase
MAFLTLNLRRRGPRDRFRVTVIVTARSIRRTVAVFLAVAAMGCAQVKASPTIPTSSWQTAAVQAMSIVRTATAQNETCRQLIRATAGGSVIRLRLSNAMSSTPLSLAAVTVGISAVGPALAGPPKLVTIGGNAAPVIGAHKVATTDPIDLVVTPGQDVAVTFAVTGTAKLTEHLLGAATGWCSGPNTGDHTSDSTRDPFAQSSREGLVVEALEVQTTRRRTDGILAVGDSLTDPPLPPDTYQRWTDVVAARTHRAMGNLAIGGNRVLLPGGYGPTLLQRFSHDVLSRPGAGTLIIFAGTNDVSSGITAAELTRRLAELTRKAKSHGFRVVLVTLAPAWKRTPDKERVRQEVNAWIRTAPEIDLRVDADALLRDPNRPTHLLRAYDFGDGLHLSAAGHRALGQAIVTTLLG